MSIHAWAMGDCAPFVDIVDVVDLDGIAYKHDDTGPGARAVTNVHLIPGALSRHNWSTRDPFQHNDIITSKRRPPGRGQAREPERPVPCHTIAASAGIRCLNRAWGDVTESGKALAKTRCALPSFAQQS